MEQGDNRRSVAAAIRDVTSSMSDVVRAEVRLAKAEVKDTGAKLGQHAIGVGACLVLLFLGLFPGLAFLVIGLGILLGGNYWLSSLVFAVLFLAIGAALGVRAFRKLRDEDYLLPEVRTSLSNEGEGVRRKLRRFAEHRRAG